MSSIFKQFFNQNKNNERKPAKIEYINEKPQTDGPLKLKANVYGTVQGVGFRFTTKQLAEQLGVNGIVRNESDGSVYTEAVGDEDKLEEFIIGLAKGPSPSSVVDKVVVEYDDSITDYNGFGEHY